MGRWGDGEGRHTCCVSLDHGDGGKTGQKHVVCDIMGCTARADDNSSLPAPSAG